MPRWWRVQVPSAEVAVLHGASVLFQPGMSRTILPSLPPTANRVYAASTSFSPNTSSTGTRTRLRLDKWQDLSLNEARSDRLVLERTSPQSGAVNACASTHELQQVDLAACTCADADDRETASDGQ